MPELKPFDLTHAKPVLDQGFSMLHCNLRISQVPPNNSGQARKGFVLSSSCRFEAALFYRDFICF
jgi:hypothetical protein